MNKRTILILVMFTIALFTVNSCKQDESVISYDYNYVMDEINHVMDNGDGLIQDIRDLDNIVNNVMGIYFGNSDSPYTLTFDESEEALIYIASHLSTFTLNPSTLSSHLVNYINDADNENVLILFELLYNSLSEDNKSIFTNGFILNYINKNGADEFIITNILQYSASIDYDLTTSFFKNVYNQSEIFQTEFNSYDDTCGYMLYDLSECLNSEHFGYKDNNLYMYNIYIGEIGNPIAFNKPTTIFDLLPDNYVVLSDNKYADNIYYYTSLTDGITYYYIEFDNMFLPISSRSMIPEIVDVIKLIDADIIHLSGKFDNYNSDIVYTSYTYSNDDTHISIPAVNHDSDFINKLNIKIRDDFFYNYLTNENYIGGELSFQQIGFDYNQFGDMLALNLYQYQHYSQIHYCDYYIDLKNEKLIEFEDYFWYWILNQLNSDEFYNVYFKNYIDRDYIITRETDNVEIEFYQWANETANGMTVAAPTVTPIEYIKLNLKGEIPLEIEVNYDASSYNNYSNNRLYYITPDTMFDISNYKVSSKSNDYVIDAYEMAFPTDYTANGNNDRYINSFLIPKINSNKTNAVKLNNKIASDFGESYNRVLKLAEANRGDCLHSVIYETDYSYFKTGNIIGIAVRNWSGLLASEASSNYRLYYYDTVNDKEIGYEEYLKSIGYTVNDILEIMNDPLMIKIHGGYMFEYDYTFTQDNILGVYQRDDGKIEIFVIVEYHNLIMSTIDYLTDDKTVSLDITRSGIGERANLGYKYYSIHKNGDYLTAGMMESDIPYEVYYEDDRSCVIGMKDDRIYFALYNDGRTIEFDIEKGDINNIEIDGIKNNILEISTGKDYIHYDFNKRIAYFDDNDDTPFYMYDAANLITLDSNSNDTINIYFPAKNVTISFKMPFPYVTLNYNYDNNIETIGIMYTSMIITMFNDYNGDITDLLIIDDHSPSNENEYINDNLFISELTTDYTNWEKIIRLHYYNGISYYNSKDDIAFSIIVYDDLVNYDTIKEIAESITVSAIR